MKKLFTILSAALLSVSAFAELAYNTTLSENDFNNNATVIAKNNASWNNGIYMTKGGFNWDEYSATVALSAGVPNKLSFTCQQSSFASTGTGFVVYESADNANWTEASKPGLSGASAHSYSADLKATTRYLKFAWAGNFSGTYTNIKVTEKILMGTPNPTSLDFGTVKVDEVVEGQTFTLGWTNLTGTATSSDSHFTVTPDAFGEIGANLQTTTFTVGLLTSEAGVYSGTITLAGRGKSAQVTVSGTVEKYDQSIAWEPAESYNFGEAIPAAVASSALDVEYEIANPEVLKFENGAFVTLYAGTTQIAAKQAGNYKFNAAADVVRTITVVAPTTYGDFAQTTCDEPVEFNEKTYTETTQEDVKVGLNFMGGDSIVHVSVVINHASSGAEEMTIAYGAEEIWNGIELKDSTVGVHTVIFDTVNAVGCDSTVTLTLTVTKQEALEIQQPLEFCEGDSVEFRGVWYKEAQESFVINAEGEIRDTVINVTITVNPKEYSELQMTDTVGNVIALPEGEWLLGEKVVAGTYELQEADTAGLEFRQYAQTLAGCEALTVLFVTVEPKPEEEQGFEQINAALKAEKFVLDGVMYIRRGDKIYTTTGSVLK